MRSSTKCCLAAPRHENRASEDLALAPAPDTAEEFGGDWQGAGGVEQAVHWGQDGGKWSCIHHVPGRLQSLGLPSRRLESLVREPL